MLVYLTTKIQQKFDSSKIFDRFYFHLHQISDISFVQRHFTRWKYILFTSTFYVFLCVIRGTFRKIRGTFREISSPLQKSGGTLDSKRGTLQWKSDFSKGGSEISNLHHSILLFYRYLQKKGGGGGDLIKFIWIILRLICRTTSESNTRRRLSQGKPVPP